MLKFTNLYDMLSVNAVKHPDKIAIYFYDESFTYAQIKAKTDLCAAVLQKHGVRKGSMVCAVLGNSPEYIFAFFAVQKLAAVWTAQSTYLKPRELSHNINDCEAEFLISAEAFSPLIKEVKGTIPSVKQYFAFEANSFSALNIHDETVHKINSDSIANLDDLALIIYTPGTISSKGVMLSHRNLLTNGMQFTEMLQTEGRNDYSVGFLPFFHAYAFMTCVIGPFYAANGTIIFASTQDIKKGNFEKYINKYRPTIMIGVPQLYSAFARWPISQEQKDAIPFRVTISGGGALTVATIETFMDTFNQFLIDGYGLSEASPIVTMNSLDAPKPGSIGKIAPYMSYRIIDPDGSNVHQGKPGELLIKGDNIMLGYWKRPEETAQALSADGWLRTGDIVREDADNYLYIVDRIKNLIIYKGLNISPKELEEHLLEHPAIEDGIIIGMPEEDGNEVVTAFVQLYKGARLSEAEAKDYMRQRFSNYKVPKSVIFVDDMQSVCEIPHKLKVSECPVIRTELKKKLIQAFKK